MVKPFQAISGVSAPCSLSEHSHSYHKTWSKLSYTSAVTPFRVSPSILHIPSQSLVFVTQWKQPQLSTAPASSSLLLHLPEPQLTTRNQVTHTPADLPCAAEATWLHSSTSSSTRSKPVQLFEKLSSYSSNFCHELQQQLKSAKTQRDQLLLPCDRQQTGAGRMSCEHRALHYAQTQFCCWTIDNDYWMSLF